jgi:hypothetical protein
MTSKNPKKSTVGRRDFLQMAGVGLAAASGGSGFSQAFGSTQPLNSETSESGAQTPLFTGTDVGFPQRIKSPSAAIRERPN